MPDFTNPCASKNDLKKCVVCCRDKIEREMNFEFTQPDSEVNNFWNISEVFIDDISEEQNHKAPFWRGSSFMSPFFFYPIDLVWDFGFGLSDG